MSPLLFAVVVVAALALGILLAVRWPAPAGHRTSLCRCPPWRREGRRSGVCPHCKGLLSPPVALSWRNPVASNRG
jgi:hypothetical protein